MNHCSLRPLETVGSSIYSRPIHIWYLSTSLWLASFRCLIGYQKVPVEHQPRLINSKRRDSLTHPSEKKKKKQSAESFNWKCATYIHKFSWAISIVPHLWFTFTHWLLSQPRITEPPWHLAIAERLAWLSDGVTVVEPQKPRRGQSAQANIMGLSGWTHLGELEWAAKTAGLLFLTPVISGKKHIYITPLDCRGFLKNRS